MPYLPPQDQLSVRGIKHLKKIISGKDGSNNLDIYDFINPEDYFKYREFLVLDPIKTSLLEGVKTPPDEKFLHNLCRILNDLQLQLYDKEDRSFD